MTIKTFDANRVGGGTFQLEQDAFTGEYKVKEVGFVKLPELKLPEIDQAAYVIPNPSNPTPDPDPDPVNPNTGNQGRDGGGGQNNFDYTGASQLKNIQKEATEFASKDMGLNRVDRTDIDQGAVKVEDIRSLESMPQSYQDLVNRYNEHQANVQEKNRSGNVSYEQGVDDFMYSKELRNQINEMKGTSVITKEGFTLTAGRKDPEIMKAAPVISEDLQKFGPTTVPTGTLTGAKTSTQFGVPDAIKFGQPSLPDPTLTSKAKTVAKDVISNLKPVSMMIVEGINNAITSPEQRLNNDANMTALNNAGLKTNYQLGNMNDPGRVAASPQDSVFGGMNAKSAFGDISKGAQSRIDTRNNIGQARVDAKYGKGSKKSVDFANKTKGYEKELQNHNNDKNTTKENTKTNKSTNPNTRSGANSDNSERGKIVCTMMNESYGFGSFRNKIWMKFHKNLSPEYQKGYHKLFLPLVKIAKTNKIIKNILEHIAVHSTIDMRQSMRGKKHLLGRIYRKVLLPLCYWVGKK